MAVFNPPSEGCTLEVVSQTEIPSRVKCGLFVPGYDSDLRSLHRLLALQNKSWYNLATWSLYKATRTEGPKPGVFLLLGIPKEEIPKIMARGRRVAYSYGSIYVASS